PHRRRFATRRPRLGPAGAAQLRARCGRAGSSGWAGGPGGAGWSRWGRVCPEAGPAGRGRVGARPADRPRAVAVSWLPARSPGRSASVYRRIRAWSGPTWTGSTWSARWADWAGAPLPDDPLADEPAACCPQAAANADNPTTAAPARNETLRMRTSQSRRAATAVRSGAPARLRRPAPPLGSAGLWTGTRNLP